MKKILLSADGPISLCLVPSVVADNLFKYISDFDDYVRKYKTVQISELEYRVTVEEVKGFIEWLNKSFNEKSEILEVIKYEELEKYKELHHWNW